jgi:hypothetical protein
LSVNAPYHRDTVSKGEGNMETEYIPIFLEKKNGSVNGAWMHFDARINAIILPLAYTSDLGILRIILSNVDKAAGVLKKKGLIVRQTADAVEIVPDGSCGLLDILRTLAEHGIDTELTGIIPGIYQG